MLAVMVRLAAAGRPLHREFAGKAAAVDDAIAWILLAGVIGIAKNGSPAQALPALLLTLVFVAFMFSAAVGIFFGFYPARKASQLDPIDALRYE